MPSRNQTGAASFDAWQTAGKAIAAYVAPPDPVDPDAELSDAIEAATTLDELKAALLGDLQTGQKGCAAAKLVD